LGLRHIREYQAELFQKHKLSTGTVNNRIAALRFFYIKTLKKNWSITETPYPKRPFHLPSILSQEEVTQLINAALTPYHRILLLTLYATGVRNAELTHLKVRDIDSKRMVIHIQGGKGRRDRDVMLSPKLLEEHRNEESFQDMPLMANRKKHSVTNTALYFAAPNSRTITRSTSSGRGSGSFSTNPPLTALNSTLLPSRNKCAARTG